MERVGKLPTALEGLSIEPTWLNIKYADGFLRTWPKFNHPRDEVAGVIMDSSDLI